MSPLLLTAVLLLQDSAAEKAMDGIKETVERATSIRAEYRVEGIPASKDGKLTARISGVIEIKQGNKVRLAGTLAVGDEKADTEFRSDGKRRFSVSGDAASVPVETPACFETETRSALTWMSLMAVWAHVGKPGERDPKEIYEAIDLKSGKDDGAYKTLEYRLARKPPEASPPKVRVWYDPKTFLVAKRTLTSERDGVPIVITETLTKVLPNADLPDDLFRVPAEK